MYERLFTPGPTQIPESVMRAMQVAAIHHRSEVFKRELGEVLEGLRWLLERPETPILLACSGTGAMEAALGRITTAGDSIVTVNAGVFGERWGKIGAALGLNVTEVKAELGDSPSTEECLEGLRRAKTPRAFCIQQCETSSTVTHPVREILTCVKAKFPQIVTIVDGISAFATEPMPGGEDLIDIYVAGSQKGLMLPAGLSIVSLNQRAWKICAGNSRRSLYFDLCAEKATLDRGETAWTPATHIILGLRESLELIRREGKVGVFLRHAKVARAIQAGIRACSLKLVTEKFPSVGITGFFPPENRCAEDIRSVLLTRYKIRTAEGQGTLKGKIVRVGHMGMISEFDAIGLIGALELTLNDLTPTALGCGSKAALHILAA